VVESGSGQHLNPHIFGTTSGCPLTNNPQCVEGLGAYADTPAVTVKGWSHDRANPPHLPIR